MSRSGGSPQVHKFGGASLADGAAVAHAVAILRALPGPQVVVCSAMAGVTDALLSVATRAGAGDETSVRVTAEGLRSRHRDAARRLLPAGKTRNELIGYFQETFAELETLAHGLTILRELTPRTSDFIAARGERASARLFTAALSAAGRRARYVDAVELIRTDGHFGGASPDLVTTDREIRRVLRPLLARGIVPVVPGFLGATPAGQVATLGRGGSDLTASLLGRALGATEVSLWKDVPGLLTADPRVVPDARVIPQLNVREAAELAYYGAKVLHPRALIPIASRDVPLYIRPFADPSSKGTEVSGRRTLLNYPVKAVSAVTGQALVTVTGNGMLGVPGIAARTFESLHRERISVSLITQASSEHSICLSVPEASAERARRSLLETFREEIRHREIDGVELSPGVATLAVVGLGMAGTPGVAARVFSALSAGGINVVAIAQGSSELNISVVVDAHQAPAAQRRIHAAFQLSKIGGGQVTRGERTDLVILGLGQIGRTLAELIAQRRPRSRQIKIVAVIDRSGFVFDPQGLRNGALRELLRAKEAGKPLAGTPGGRAASALETVGFVARHALSRPILVDLTAEDTGAVLKQGLAAGLDLVLANKRPLAGRAREAAELWETARAHGKRLLHEATVGAGLPIIDTYHKLVDSGDSVLKIEGCLSGTLGFLLSEIGRGQPFSTALRQAMALGYTEPDPRDDLSGTDVARKALILGRLMGFPGELGDVRLEPLLSDSARRLTREKFLERLESYDRNWAEQTEGARRKGGVLRYVATISRRRIQVGLRIATASSPFAALNGTDNQVAFTTTRYRSNPLVISGPGAGPAVTAAGVLNDILALA